MAATDRQSLASLDSLGPAQVAGELCHLPGLVFLDSSSADHDPSKKGAHFSLITAQPCSELRGNLFHRGDREALQQLLASHRLPEETTPDLGFPGAGLYGTIDYEGSFHFGEYHEYLLYDHQRQVWAETGTLSSLRRPSASALESSVAPLSFRDSCTRESFCDQVERARDYIAQGDIYQINLSHRLQAPRPHGIDPYALYLRLREISPAPYAAYLAQGERTILSSSPEQFLHLSGRTIQTRPIKGTRPRFRDREQDEKSAYDLITSPKEIAELVMITDLERNDLGQICTFGSVVASELLKLERYAQVFHLVSTVEGTLRPEIDHVDALLACFPGGSITGAPKKRAREIIHELETEARGVYTGAIGCFGFNGESRFNIAIRTLIAEAETIHFHVGAGIVTDSIPEKEWEETLHKAVGILQACQSELATLE